MSNSVTKAANMSHPKGIYLLFFTEMWERVNYFGMRAIFILFLTKALMFSDQDGSTIYGSFTGLVYLTPLLGGYLCDRYLGNRKSIITGGILMAIGQFIMFLCASVLENRDLSITLMWIGLTIMIMGNGFFKPNISTMVGKLYPKGDHRIDSAFTIFYMGVNVGAFIAPLICGGAWVVGDIHTFKWGFLAAFIGMIISVLAFYFYQNKYVVTAEGEPIGMPVQKLDLKTLGMMIGATLLLFFLLSFKSFFKLDWDVAWYLILTAMIAVPALIITDKSLTAQERSRIWVIFIIVFFVIFFWSAFEQAGASLTLFADRNIDRAINVKIPKEVLVILGIAIAYFASRALVWLFEWKKMIIYIVTGLAAVIMLWLVFNGTLTGLHLTEFTASWFQSVNPLAIIVLAPFFTFLWGWLDKRKMEPASPVKMVWGIAILCLGYILIAYGVKGVDSQTKIAMWWLVALYVLHTIGELCLSPIGLSMVSKLAPVRFGSLLMGTWYLSSAFSNKFAGTLSSYIPPSAEDVAAGIAHYRSLLGFQITNLYDFFTVFIVMSGAAAIILLILSGWLKKMMHGIR